MSNDDIELDEHRGLREDTMDDPARSRVTERVGDLTTRALRGVPPGRGRRPFDRAAWFRDFYGLEPGVTPCESCGTIVQASDHGKCSHCGRPYAARCEGIWVPDPDKGQRHDKCTTRILPNAYTVTTSRGAVRTLWDESERMCVECKRKVRYGERLERWIGAFRAAGGKEREDYARDTLLPHIRDYKLTPWRAELDCALKEWLDGDGPRSLFVHGSVGCGKTTAIARASFIAFVEQQTIGSFAWLEQDDLLTAYKAQYGDVDRERRNEARRLLDTFERAELVVVDEMFSAHSQKNPWTATAAQDIGVGLRRRFQSGRRTLFTSNTDPCMDGALEDSLWAKAFDDRLADRARASMRVIALKGQSMRPAAAVARVIDIGAPRRKGRES